MVQGSLRATRRAAVAVTVCALALVAGCSDDDTTANPEATASPADETRIAEAAEALQALVTRPAEVAVTEPVGKAIPQGKEVAWLVCGVPECTVLTPPVEKAAAALGWTVRSIPAGLTPETVLNAWNLAVQQKPDAVMGTGFPKVLFEKPLQQLNAAKIPVSYGFVTDPAGDGIIAMINGTENFFRPSGTALADFVLGSLGTKAKTLFIGGTTFPGTAFVEEAFKAEYTRLCPECGYESLNPPATAIGTKIVADVTAFLTRNPDINYVVATQPSQVAGLPQALNTAGIDVSILVNSPDQTTVQYLKDGLIDGIMMSTQQDAMWQMMDALARHFAGVPVKPSEAATPIWVVTRESADQLTYPYFLVENYEEQFKRLWGVS